MANNVCRVGDIVTGFCSAGGHGSNRPFTGHWTTSFSTILSADGIQVILTGDQGITDCGHTFVASTGSNVVTVGGLALHRVGDEVVVIGGGYGHSVTGTPEVTSV